LIPLNKHRSQSAIAGDSQVSTPLAEIDLGLYRETCQLFVPFIRFIQKIIDNKHNKSQRSQRDELNNMVAKVVGFPPHEDRRRLQRCRVLIIIPFIEACQ
jgi:hypothetical protein